MSADTMPRLTILMPMKNAEVLASTRPSPYLSGSPSPTVTAKASMSHRICLLLAPRCDPHASAATPATWGHAIDVPLM